MRHLRVNAAIVACTCISIFCNIAATYVAACLSFFCAQHLTYLHAFDHFKGILNTACLLCSPSIDTQAGLGGTFVPALL